MKRCEVPFTVLNKTTQCKHDFSCLHTGEYKGPNGCEVDSIHADNLLFLKESAPYPACPYRSHLNDRQLCLCPIKFNCYFRQQDEDSAFKQCAMCKKAWGNYHDFLSDPDISLIGYQVAFDALEAGLFLFNHSCNNTLAIPAEAFTHLYNGPIFKERATGTDKCPGYCLDKCQLQPCVAECECAYVREVLQIVKGWPKKDSGSTQ